MVDCKLSLCSVMNGKLRMTKNKINRKEIIFPERRMRAVSGTQRDGGMAEGTDRKATH